MPTEVVLSSSRSRSTHIGAQKTSHYFVFAVMKNTEPQLSIKPFIDSLSLTLLDPKIYFLASVFVSFP